ncbi:ParB N-terminal domain-containing protein [Candidatus Bathyarchaeota archaeon]|nr:ParB N-terminal domain-containing protein [Candidatus Bathyarchaeota archaeon]MBS7630653.1 ParB N-terminal domain-containing protein [Candidatus Bathyarchaeota archaeon]
MSCYTSQSYSIKHENENFEITLIEIDRLVLHEEIVPEMLKTLISKIRKDQRQISPVIVDKETLVVLDGMHRVEALRKFGCRFVGVCLVDYMSESIRIERWCRTVSERFDPIFLSEKTGLRFLQVNIETPMENQLFLSLYDSKYLVQLSKEDIQLAFEAVRRLETCLKDMRKQINYEAERQALEKLETGSIFAIIYPPKIGKKQVLESAMNGRLFIPKATRHIFPARVIEASIPLTLLQNKDLSVQKANKIFLETIKNKKLKQLQPGTVVNGRVYEEYLYMLE